MKRAAAFEARRPARVVEVEVGEHESVDVLGPDAELLEALSERRPVVDGVEVPRLRVPPVPEARLDERDEALAPHEKAVRREAHAVPVVRGELPLPEHFRHDPEHRAAVEAKLRAANDVDSKSAELQEASF